MVAVVDDLEMRLLLSNLSTRWREWRARRAQKHAGNGLDITLQINEQWRRDVLTEKLRRDIRDRQAQERRRAH